MSTLQCTLPQSKLWWEWRKGVMSFLSKANLQSSRGKSTSWRVNTIRWCSQVACKLSELLPLVIFLKSIFLTQRNSYSIDSRKTKLKTFFCLREKINTEHYAAHILYSTEQRSCCSALHWPVLYCHYHSNFKSPHLLSTLQIGRHRRLFNLLSSVWSSKTVSATSPTQLYQLLHLHNCIIYFTSTPTSLTLQLPITRASAPCPATCPPGNNPTVGPLKISSTLDWCEVVVPTDCTTLSEQEQVNV